MDSDCGGVGWVHIGAWGWRLVILGIRMGEGGVYELAWVAVGTLGEAGEEGGGVGGGEGEEEREVAGGFHGCC